MAGYLSERNGQAHAQKPVQIRGAAASVKARRAVCWLSGMAVGIIIFAVCILAAFFYYDVMCWRVNLNYCFSLYKLLLVPLKQSVSSIKMKAKCFEPRMPDPFLEAFYYMTWRDMPVEDGSLPSCIGLHEKVRDETTEFVLSVSGSRNVLLILVIMGVGIHMHKMSTGVSQTLLLNIVAIFFMLLPFLLDWVLSCEVTRDIFFLLAAGFARVDITSLNPVLNGVVGIAQVLANNSKHLHAFLEHIVHATASVNKDVDERHIRAIILGVLRLSYYLLALVRFIPHVVVYMEKDTSGIFSFTRGSRFQQQAFQWVDPLDSYETMQQRLRMMELTMHSQLLHGTNLQHHVQITNTEMSFVQRQLYVYVCFVYFDILRIINLELATFDSFVGFDQLEFFHVLWFGVLHLATRSFKRCSALEKVLFAYNLMIFAMVNLHLTVHALGPNSIGDASIRASNENISRK
jgi:hypothetical protein